MTPAKQKRNFFKAHFWEIVLAVISSGSIVSLVHIWETPADLKALMYRVTNDEAFANTINTRQAVMESNLENETKLVNMMQDNQRRMWDKIEELKK